MNNIVEFYEKIQKKQNLFNFIDLSRSYSYLKNYNKKDMLIIGSIQHPKYTTLKSFDIDKISPQLNKYKLFVLDKYVCKLPIEKITEKLKLFKSNKKKDDLADAFLMCMYFGIKNKYINNF